MTALQAALAMTRGDGPSPSGEADVPVGDCPPSGFGTDQGAIALFEGLPPSGEANASDSILVRTNSADMNCLETSAVIFRHTRLSNCHGQLPMGCDVEFITHDCGWHAVGKGHYHKYERLTDRKWKRLRSEVSNVLTVEQLQTLEDRVSSTLPLYAIHFSNVQLGTCGNSQRHPSKLSKGGSANNLSPQPRPACSVLNGKCPNQSLRSTADHFIDHLPNEAFAELKYDYAALSGTTLRIATICSGGDVFVTAWKLLIDAMNKRTSRIAT